jgi:hypothetical protein
VRTKLIGNIPYDTIIVDPSDVERFYDDFYGWLKGEGVDFVKTDVQHMVSMLEDAKDREEVPAAYQRAWTVMTLKHFGGKAISCMSQTPQTLFHSLLQTHTPRLMHRNSDDFYPEIDDSNPWHIFVNAHNALLDRHLNVIPDWDMFQTVHPWSAYHGAARCVSGGPILITDVPGQHDRELVEMMTATEFEGGLKALRCTPAAVISPWRGYAEGGLCRIGTTAGGGEGAGVLGLFNVGEAACQEFVRLEEFPGLNHGQGVVVGSFRTGQIFGPMIVGDKDRNLMHASIASRGYDILVASPVVEGVAVLGLQGKMSGAAAVAKQSVVKGGEGIDVKVTVKALGKLALWTDVPSTTVTGFLIDGKEVASEYVAVEKQVSNHGADVSSCTVILDLLAYWNDQKLWERRSELEVTCTLVHGK